MPSHNTMPTIRTVATAGSYAGDPTAVRAPAARELRLEALTDEQQQIYWCIDLAEPGGLDVQELEEMTTLHPQRIRAALVVLEQLGHVQCEEDDVWHVTPKARNGGRK